MHYSASEIMFCLISREICDSELPADLEKSLTPDILSELYNLSKPHDMAHIIASAVLALDLPLDAELKKKLLHSQMTAVYRHAQIRHELVRITEAFEEAKIPFIPLKGSVIRQYYKKPEMRTSCDIDVFVAEENLDAACRILTDKFSYTLDVRTSHDVAFYSKSQTHVELHFDLIERDERVKSVLSRVWELSRAEGGEYRHVMSGELFYAYHIAHMAKHFLGGGCGIRPFLDLFIIESKMEYDKAAALALVCEMGLEKFAKEAKSLSEVWFSGAEHTDTTREMENYILGAGIYGSTENRMAVMHTKQKGKLRYALSRIFLPYSRLKKIYPGLEKYPVLLPYYEIKRWFRYLSRHGLSSGKSELKSFGAVDDEILESVSALCEKLEL